MTGFGAVTHAARVRIGDRVCVIGCGGVGLQVIAAARLAGAATIVAVDRGPDKLEHALRRGATHAVDANAVDVGREVRARTVGRASTSRSRSSGRPRRSGPRGIRCAPGGTAVVVGVAPVGVEVALPAIEFLSEKSIIGSYYGSSDPSVAIPRLVDLVCAGRLELADVVSHLITLDEVQGAFERLRTGEGERSVVILDSAAAGASPGGAI